MSPNFLEPASGHCRLYENHPLIPFLSQTNPVFIVMSYFSKIQPVSTSASQGMSLLQIFGLEFCICFSAFSACGMSVHLITYASIIVVMFVEGYKL